METIFRNEFALIPQELIKDVLSSFKIKAVSSSEDLQALVNIALKFGVEDVVDALSESTLKKLCSKLSIEWQDDAIEKLQETFSNDSNSFTTATSQEQALLEAICSDLRIHEANNKLLSDEIILSGFEKVLESLTVALLRKLATHFGVSYKGTKKEGIQTIIKAIIKRSQEPPKVVATEETKENKDEFSKELLESKTVKDLRKLLEIEGVKVNSKDVKAVLITKLLQIKKEQSKESEVTNKENLSPVNKDVE